MAKQDRTVKIIRQPFENTDLDCWAVCRTDVEEIPKLFFYQVSGKKVNLFRSVETARRIFNINMSK